MIKKLKDFKFDEWSGYKAQNVRICREDITFKLRKTTRDFISFG